MKIVAPALGTKPTISSNTGPPKIAFVTDAAGPHSWDWEVTWRGFRKAGRAATAGNKWEMQSELADLGGELRVVARAGLNTASLALTVIGANPTEAEVEAFLKTLPNSSGFIDLLRHETKCKHFNAAGQPVVSFDNGYGMCQLTTPPPTYDQAWSWKRNVIAGLALFAVKRKAALSYLSQGGRSYNDTQLKKETICRWNGGAYHRWNADKGAWERNSNILCDPNTGNIGWDMTKKENVGKTLQTLRARDKSQFSKPPKAGSSWGYFGVCYADRILP